MREVSDTMIEAAEIVRAWPGVEVVDVGRSEGEIYVQMNGVSIADMVQLARDQVIVDAELATVVVFGWGDGGIKGYIAVSESLPSATLIDAMETLRALPDVESISYTSFALSDESALGQQFELKVATDDIEAVRLVLERTQIAPGDGSCHQYALTSDESYVSDEFGVCE